MITAREKMEWVVRAAEETKAEDVHVLDLEGLTLIADYFVICSGRSDVHIESIAERIEERLLERKVRLHHREGERGSRWVLLDFGDVVVHIFDEESRRYYDLEQLWGDAPTVDLDSLREAQQEGGLCPPTTEPDGSSGP